MKCPEGGECHWIFDDVDLGLWLGGVLSLRKELKEILVTLSSASCEDGELWKDFDSSQ